jgi:hypothetical protein
MPEIIIKAPIFTRLEAMSRIPGMKDNPMLSAAIARLKNPQNKLIDVAKDMFLYADDAQASHFKKDWLNDPPGGGFWAQQGIDVEPIIRAGLVLACEKFQATGLPCEYFWVASGDNKTSRWEISVTVGVDRITIIFHTPQYATAVGATRQSPKTWIVREENGVVVTRPALEPA